MSFTAILPLSYLNEACFLSLNTDDKKYNMVLKLAQQELRDELGQEFYDQLVSQYPNYTGDNLALYDDYIKDYLAWLTYFKYLKFANLDATPTGIREFNDENSSVASDIKMYSLEKNVLQTANDYKYRMVNFLKESQSNDSTKYPLWENDCKEYLSFAITSVDKNSDALIRVNKSITTNE
jgi:hypothetical protein